MIAPDARRRLRDEQGEDGRQAKADAQQADETEDIADVDEEQSRAQNSQAKAGVEQPPVPNPQRQQSHQHTAQRETPPISADPGA